MIVFGRSSNHVSGNVDASCVPVIILLLAVFSSQVSVRTRYPQVMLQTLSFSALGSL